MMGIHQPQKELFSYEVDLDRRVRTDHPLRRLNSVLDLAFVRAEVARCYGFNGHVSVDPVVLVKLMILLFLEDIPSERELTSRLAERLDYLWFLGFGLDTPIPNHSVLSKARKRWGKIPFGSGPDIRFLKAPGRTTSEIQVGVWTNTFAYNPAGNLLTLSDGKAQVTTWGYNAERQVVSKKHPNGLTNTYDSRARLLSTQLRNELHAVLNSHAYLLDGLMRTRMTRTDGSYEDYGYDNAGQLRTVTGSAGGTNSFSYGYDAAQNLAARTNGVTVQTFTVNNLNQLTGGPTASYTHDSNGNLTGFGSGNGVYLYDAENQLVTAYVTNNWRSDFIYDGRGRLRTRKEFNWSGGTWSLSTETRYLYEGMRVVQERNGSDVPQVTYTRGTDLSGGREGAGGIGGLLGRSHGYNAGTGAWATHHFYHADGNGNVTYLVNTSRTLGASYRYDAYGRTTATGTGTLAPSDNVYRFSSKELHAKSGLYYYGYRFYDPNLQRWANRDPIGEEGGLNLYGFVGNDPVGIVDSFGLSSIINHQAAALALRLEAEELGITVAQLVARRAAEKIAKEALEKAAKEFAKQCKKLSNSQIKALQKRGIDPHDFKPNSKFDLFYHPRTREIFVKPKSGTGPGDPTGIFVP